MLKSLWKFLANVKLTLYLLFFIALNLVVGALYIKFYPDIFRPLNHMLFQEWCKAYPTGKAWWIFFLFSLLALLGVNTFACTLQRLTDLCARRREYPFKRFLLIISPSLMHVFFLVALSGHALSMFAGEHKEFVLKNEETIILPAFMIDIKKMHPVFWEQSLMKKSLKQCMVALDIKTSSGVYSKKLSFLHPFWFHGWSFFLDMDRKPGSGLPPGFKLLIKRDPGATLILWGGALLSCLMTWYFLNYGRNKEKR